MKVKFINVATSQRSIDGAKSALATNPNMWHGIKAGYRGLITAHQNHIAKAKIQELTTWT